MSDFLQRIDNPKDIKALDEKQLNQLAKEIREFLINNVSKTGGHLASNLGVVELTLALHKVFSTPEDKIVWDVGHQSYVHKILTGRKNKFCTLRQAGGISGFPKVSESEHDCFNTGHSSTSISAALGIAKARDIKKQKHSVLAIIGDGALTGGLAFEALNDAGRSPNNFIVILNDNGMSISNNVGGLSRYLSKMRTEPIYLEAKQDIDTLLSKIPSIGKKAANALKRAKGIIKYMIVPGMLFEELGFKYLGPINGHDIGELANVLERAKNSKGPVLIHVCTMKGKGYSYAEENPSEFHGVSSFDIETGESKTNGGPTYSDVFGEELVKLAREDDSVTAITAAMPNGTGLSDFAAKFPDRFFDVGIAEQHAMTFSAGIASSGLKPVVAVYSSFLQRGYDQIIHDIAMQNLHVVIAIDRAGVVGEDGETHQGIYDISYLSHIPNMTIMAPADYQELRSMLRYALMVHKGPISIRYPRGRGAETLGNNDPIAYGKACRVRDGSDVVIVAFGSMVPTALKCSEILAKAGISAQVINARFAKPLDAKLIMQSAAKCRYVVTLEDNTIKGGFGSEVLELINQFDNTIQVKTLALPDQPVLHGTRNDIFKRYGLDEQEIAVTVTKFLRKNNTSQKRA